ncbi:MAG: MFS transporter [Candidatus Eremiobacteraeota bacterium]|nr:MFS transporter [Candidatus Eremiobacteraeota bacterium]
MIRKLTPILGITFIDIVGFSMLLPILPYFVTHFGMSPVVVGLLLSTFSLCQLISGPIWGNVSDRIGRKAVLIISQIGATIGWAMLAFAPNIAWVFVARIIEGASGGNISITQAYVADVVEPKQRAKAFGYISATFAAGMVFGPAGGGILFSKFGFAAPFLAASLLQLLTLILTVVLLPESRSKTEGDEHVGSREIMTTFTNPRLSPLLLQKLALSLALYGWYSAIALYLAGQLHFNVVQTTQYFSLLAVVSVVINGFGVGKTSNKLGDRVMSSLGLVLLVGAFALAPFVHNVWTLTGVMVLFATGGAFANTGLTAMISNAATAREQGTVLGVSSSLDSFSGILAPPLSTGLLARYGSPFASVESLIMSAISLALGIRNSLRAPRVVSDVQTQSVTTPPAEELV